MPVSTACPADVSPFFFLRVAGLPLHELHRLQAGATARYLEQCRGARAEMATAGPAIVGLLEQIIPCIDDRRERRSLLQLKRDVFNRRVPRREDLEVALGLTWSKSDCELLENFGSLMSTCIENMRLAARHFEEDQIAIRGALREIASTDDVMNGVLASSPDLLRALDRYSKATRPRLSKQERRAERSVVNLVYRTLFRPTPLSTLATVAYGSWLDSGDANSVILVSGETRRTSVRVNQALVLALTRDADCSGGLSLRLNPNRWNHEGKLCWTSSSWTLPKSRPFKFSTTDAVARVPESPILDAIQSLEIWKTSPCSEQILRERLTECFGGADSSQISGLMSGLVKQGLLERGPFVPESLPGYFAMLREVLNKRPEDACQEVANLLDELEDKTSSYARAAHAERRNIRRSISDTLVDACASALLEPIEQLDRYSFFEDVALTTNPIGCHCFFEDKDLDALRCIARLAVVFDLSAIMRAEAADFFRLEFAAHERVPLMEFYSAYLAWFRDHFKEGAVDLDAERSGGWAGMSLSITESPSLEPIVNTQVKVMDLLKARVAESRGATVRLEPKDLTVIVEAASRRRQLSDLSAVSIFFNRVRGSEGHRILITRVLAGQGKYLSRFSYLFDDAEDESGLTQELKRWVLDTKSDATIIADMTASFGHNASIRAPITEYALEYPGSFSFLDANNTITMSDIVVSLTPDGSRLSLIHENTGREIIVLDRALLHLSALPPFYQFLAQISATPNNPFLDAMFDGLVPDRSELTYVPRICISDVVLRGAFWSVPIEAIPQRESNDDDFAYFVKVRDWALEIGLPPRVYLRPTSSLQFVDQLKQSLQDRQRRVDSRMAGAGIRFSQLIDFDSPFGAVSLAAAVSTADGFVEFEESFVDDLEPALQIDGRPHATEWMVELRTN